MRSLLSRENAHFCAGQIQGRIPNAIRVLAAATSAAMTFVAWGCGSGSADPLAAGAETSEGNLGGAGGGAPAGPLEVPGAGSFVVRNGTRLELEESEFRFAGSNNYYLMYSSPFMVDDVLGAAQRAGFNTMRTWGFLDIGNQDGSSSVRGPSGGVYFQYWGGGAPAYNDGENGLERLDYVIAKAGELGLRLVIPLVNNWNDFGGMDQYVRWRADQSAAAGEPARTWFHDDFYTDPTIRGWYQDWISHVLGRVNTLTGVSYRDDPTIIMWELANEPRCGGAGVYGRSMGCTTDTLTSWADVMTAHVRSLDPNHLISVGDEGFYCVENGSHFTEQCSDGVDTIALLELPNVDVMSVHLYPDAWGTDAAWGTEWITRHVTDAKAIGKVSLLGEFGLLNTAIRNRVYHEWMQALQAGQGNGALYWILSGRQDNGGLYGDFDGFTIYEGTPTFQTLTNFAASITEGAAPNFAPVAEHDTGYLTHDTTATLQPLANDVAYGEDPSTLRIDLDVEQAGVQNALSMAGYTLDAPAGGVSITPAPGFVGRLEVPYSVHDSAGRESNPATLTIVVSPDPAVLTSFEAGTDNWGPQNPANGGTVTQSNAFATDGTFGLEVTGTTNNWFGVQLPQTLDLSARRALTYDVRVGDGVGVGAAARIFFGQMRCQSQFTQLPPSTTQTVEIDLINMSCDGPRPPDGRATSLYLRFTPGTHHLDNLQVK